MREIKFVMSADVLFYGKFAIVLIVFGVMLYWLSSKHAQKSKFDALSGQVERLREEKAAGDKARRDALNAGQRVNRDIAEK